MLFSITAFGEKSLLNPLEQYKGQAMEIYKSLSGKNILNLILGGLPNAFSNILQSFNLCICVILISSIFSLLSENFKISNNSFDIISSCIVAILSLYPIALCIESLEKCLSSICAYMISFIPISAILHTASGNSVTASITTPSISYAVTILEFLSTSLLLPCIKSMATIMCINLLCKKANLSSVFNLIKSFSLWVIGLCFTIFTSLISLQSILTASADNLAMKGIKYGVSRLIPIAGGMVSESMRTVVASTSFVKSVTGMGGVIFIIYTVLPPLLTLLSAKVFFFLTGCFSSLSSSNLSSFFTSASSLLNLMISLLLGCSVAFIIIFGIFIKTSVVL